MLQTATRRPLFQRQDARHGARRHKSHRFLRRFPQEALARRGWEAGISRMHDCIPTGHIFSKPKRQSGEERCVSQTPSSLHLRAALVTAANTTHGQRAGRAASASRCGEHLEGITEVPCNKAGVHKRPEISATAARWANQAQSTNSQDSNAL